MDLMAAAWSRQDSCSNALRVLLLAIEPKFETSGKQLLLIGPDGARCLTALGAVILYNCSVSCL